MRGPRVLFVALIGCTLFATACSDDAADDAPPPAQDGGGEGAGGDEPLPTTAAVGIADAAFEPSILTIASGRTDITVTNADAAAHTFTLDDGSVDEAVPAGGSTTVTVDLSASAGFHCSIHPSMTGTLQVA